MPKTIRIDSRHFLKTINNSAQSQIVFLEERITQMGAKTGRVWKLSALHNDEVYFEDVADNVYYKAEVAKNNGKITISDISKIEIVEESKQSKFDDACLQLVGAIEENNQSSMSASFNKLKGHRFSGRAVPHSGHVRCKDNVLRKIHCTTDNICEDVKDRLVSIIVESLRDNVIVENGHVVAGQFNDTKVKLPVTKWAARKLVAKRMLEAAKNAYWSEGFQNRILVAANLISENKIEEAVKSISPFLDEMEEFTLLTKKQSRELIENALAAKGIFNQSICEDTATLFHRTNLKINKSKIVREWGNISKAAEHHVLAENVQILSESNNFESSYDKFLRLIFEAISNRDVAAEALATTLQTLREKTPKIKESHDLSSKLENLISRLKDPAFDDAAIYEAEDLIATIQEELNANESLKDFDQIPDGMDDGSDGDIADLVDDEIESETDSDGAPVININSPLIQIGGTSGGGASEEPELELDDDLENDLGDEDIEDLGGDIGDELNGEGDETDELADALDGLGESKKRRKSIREEDEDEEDSDDPYYFESVSTGNMTSNYGTPVIADSADLDKIVRIIKKLAVEHSLDRKTVFENIEKIAKAGIKAVGLHIPEGRIPAAIDQITTVLESDESMMDFEDDDEEDFDDVAESQYNGPWIKKRGLKKTDYQCHEDKNTTLSRGVVWKESQDDAILGEFSGVEFIFDHAINNESLDPSILSSDGGLEIPIPTELTESAYAAAGMELGYEANPRPFLEWLYSAIEKLKPISEDEDREIDEAVAKITTTPDGEINVEVSDDIGVNQMGDMDDEMPDDGPMMNPVDSVGVDSGVDEDPEIDGEPDFEAGMDMDSDQEADGSPVDGSPVDDDSMEDEIPGPPPMGDSEADDDDSDDDSDEYEDDDEEGMPFEDDDMTEPKSSKYTSHVKEDPRKQTEVKVPKKNDGEKLKNVGPEVKQGNKSGSNPPTAKKTSNK